MNVKFLNQTDLEGLKAATMALPADELDGFLYGEGRSVNPLVAEINRAADEYMRTLPGYKPRADVIRDGFLKAKTLGALLMLVRKPERVFFIASMARYLSVKDYGEAITDAWTSAENPAGSFGKLSGELFTGIPKDCLMKSDELAVYNALPAVVEIFRGVSNQKGRRKIVKGFSWTLDQKVAEFFAERFIETGQKKGELLKTKVRKEAIYLYVSNRTEAEVIVEPRMIKSVQRL